MLAIAAQFLMKGRDRMGIRSPFGDELDRDCISPISSAGSQVV
jgi:hypothetical protein